MKAPFCQAKYGASHAIFVLSRKRDYTSDQGAQEDSPAKAINQGINATALIGGQPRWRLIKLLEIIDRHQGQIKVESAGTLGQGATFSVWLPVQEV